MTINEYIKFLEPQVDPVTIYNVQDWNDSDKLYIYLHTIQLANMDKFHKLLQQHVDK